MTKCKSCGQEIAKSAKACPNCGAKVKHLPVGVIIAVVVVVVLIIAVSGNSSNTPKKVESTAGQTSAQSPTKDNSASKPAPTEKVPEQTVFHKGDTVELNDIHVTLLDVKESTGDEFFGPNDGNVYVTFDIEINNKGSKEITVSSLLMFDAYFDDYATELSISAEVDADANSLDGTVAPGKKMKGTIGYEVPEDWKTAEIHITPDFWKGGDIIFEYTKK